MAAEGVEQLETYFGKYLSQLFYSLLAFFKQLCHLRIYLINVLAGIIQLRHILTSFSFFFIIQYFDMNEYSFRKEM